LKREDLTIRPLDLRDETLEEQVIRLQRELAHVREQSQVVWATAKAWKARALAAEKRIPKRERNVRQPTNGDGVSQDDTDEDFSLFSGGGYGEAENSES
jgi:hypothetical protein